MSEPVTIRIETEEKEVFPIINRKGMEFDLPIFEKEDNTDGVIHGFRTGDHSLNFLDEFYRRICQNLSKTYKTKITYSFLVGCLGESGYRTGWNNGIEFLKEDLG